MKKILLPLGAGVGALGLFVGAFFVFLSMMGAEMHEVALVGSFFEAPPEAEAEDDEGPDAPPPEIPPSQPERVASLGVVDVFRIDSPYSASELEQLVRDLKHKTREFDERLAALEDREERLQEREEFLDEKYAALQELRTGLENWEVELNQRQAEVARDEAAEAEREAESWKRLATLFSKGDAAEQSSKLTNYTPEEAARILAALKPTRAKELLDALTGETWKRYAEAFRQFAPEPDEEP